jgi:hypothetical protein
MLADIPATDASGIDLHTLESPQQGLLDFKGYES